MAQVENDDKLDKDSDLTTRYVFSLPGTQSNRYSVYQVHTTSYILTGIYHQVYTNKLYILYCFSRSHFTSIYIPLPTPMHQADVTIKPSLKQSSQSLRMGRMMARVNKVLD